MAGEVGFDGVAEEVEGGAALLGAGGEDGPDALTPGATVWATGALRDMTVDHHEAERLFRKVVGGFHAGDGDELEVGIAMQTEPIGEVLGFRGRGHIDERGGERPLARSP